MAPSCVSVLARARMGAPMQHLIVSARTTCLELSASARHLCSASRHLMSVGSKPCESKSNTGELQPDNKQLDVAVGEITANTLLDAHKGGEVVHHGDRGGVDQVVVQARVDAETVVGAHQLVRERHRHQPDSSALLPSAASRNTVVQDLPVRDMPVLHRRMLQLVLVERRKLRSQVGGQRGKALRRL